MGCGFHWGEWLEPGGDGDDCSPATRATWAPPSCTTPPRGRPTSAGCSARTRTPPGSTTLAAGALDAWRTEYIGAGGSLTPDTQANHVRALAFGLVPDELRAADRHTPGRAGARGRHAPRHRLPRDALCCPCSPKPATSTSPTRCSFAGHAAVVAGHGGPRGDHGLGVVGGHRCVGRAHASLNHYSKGAVISSSNEHVAGILLLDDHLAYRRFRVAPLPGGGLSWARRSTTPLRAHRVVLADRRLVELHLTVTVPAGTTADVHLPDGTPHEQSPGTLTHECAWP